MVYMRGLTIVEHAYRLSLQLLVCVQNCAHQLRVLRLNQHGLSGLFVGFRLVYRLTSRDHRLVK